MKGDKSLAADVAFFKRVKDELDNAVSARSVEMTD